MLPHRFFRLLPALAIVLGLISLAAVAQDSHSKANVVCSECHSCPNPTGDNPCLRGCPRPHATPQDLELGPDVVTLNDLEYEYEGVIFEHRRHAQMSAMGKECSNCHHYETAGRVTACVNCHPTSAPDQMDQPGLKGAYHRQCMGCHDEWSGASSCDMCHLKKATPAPAWASNEPPAMPRRAMPPLEQPDKKVWNSTYGGGTVVTLHHKAHNERYGVDCATCHHAEGCGSCHQRSASTQQVRHSEEALHGICNGCHAEMSCNQCHRKDEAPEFTHDRTGFPLKRFHADLACRSCHGSPTHFTKPSAVCTACHAGFEAGKFNHVKTGLALDDNHRDMDCAECHPNQNFASRPTCAGCHGDDKVFPANVPGAYKR